MQITAQLFGGIVARNMVTNNSLGIALKYVSLLLCCAVCVYMQFKQ